MYVYQRRRRVRWCPSHSPMPCCSLPDPCSGRGGWIAWRTFLLSLIYVINSVDKSAIHPYITSCVHSYIHLCLVEDGRWSCSSYEPCLRRQTCCFSTRWGDVCMYVLLYTESFYILKRNFICHNVHVCMYVCVEMNKLENYTIFWKCFCTFPAYESFRCELSRLVDSVHPRSEGPHLPHVCATTILTWPDLLLKL